MTKTITIDPVTRIEGHAKITIQHRRSRRGQRRPVPRHRVSRLREVLRRPQLPRNARHHSPHLRHLPGQPSADFGQGRRRHHGCAHPTDCREAAPPDELGADRAEPCLSFFHLSAPDLLLGMESGPAQRNIMGLIEQVPARGRARRHPPAPVWPGGDPHSGRQERPPVVGRTRRSVGRTPRRPARHDSGNAAGGVRHHRAYT